MGVDSLLPHFKKCLPNRTASISLVKLVTWKLSAIVKTQLGNATVMWLRKKHGSTSRDGKAHRKIGLEPLETRCLLAADFACIGFASEIHEHGEHEHGAEIRYDSYGSYYIDDHIEAGADVGSANIPAVDSAFADFDPNTVPIRIDEVPSYHSNPDASQTIYLDFNGQRISRTGWNENNDGKTIGAPAYDTDNNPRTFNAAEQHAIKSIWARVSEDFSPFDIDVTTESPSAREFSEGSKAIRVLVSSNVDELSGKPWFDNVGGVAYVGSWNFASDTPVWVFSNMLGGNEKRVAEAISHEVGHALGLDHDGTTEKEYFGGYGNGSTSWAPIMGSGSAKAVTQWSRGEYLEANNAENDLSVIASDSNAIEFRADDHSSTFYSPTPLNSNAQGKIFVSGLISTSTDTDIFVFDIEAGAVDLQVSAPSLGSNLDIQLTLYDHEVNIVGTINPQDSLSAEIDANLPAGRYFLRIDGVGRGDPKSDGYSEYGSIGQYAITGSMPTGKSAIVNVVESNAVVASNVGADKAFGFADFLLLANSYGTVTTSDTEAADLDRDGRVDFSDFLILSKNYGG